MKKKLVRPRDGKVICGVCAGVANYFEIDPTVVRVAWAVLSALGGGGVIAYIICALIIPEDSGYIDL